MSGLFENVIIVGLILWWVKFECLLININVVISKVISGWIF